MYRQAERRRLRLERDNEDLHEALLRARLRAIETDTRHTSKLLYLTGVIKQLEHELYRNGNHKTQTNPSAKFSKSQLRQMIQLCHPDRHNSSKTSIEITQLLVSMKDTV